jgi:hypothetical protein
MEKKELGTLPQTVGGPLDFRGCDLSGVTLPQTVGGSLYLSGCDLSGVTLPQTVGGSLDLSGVTNIQNGVYNCGNEDRTIVAYNHPTKGKVVSLGCFIGTEEECVSAISAKYTGDSALQYCQKIHEAFNK